MGKLDAKQSRIVIMVLVAVVIIVAFRFGYTPITEKVDEVVAENEVLSAKLAELENVRDNAEQFRAELAAAISGMDSIKQRFAAGITPQKAIMTMRELETAAEISVNGIGFDEAENIYTSSFVGDSGEPVIANRSELNVNYTASYEGLKKSFEFINSYGDYMNLNGVTAAYNQETGMLMGNITINLYSLTGLGKMYEDPKVDGIGLSKDNIFGTMR